MFVYRLVGGMYCQKGPAPLSRPLESAAECVGPLEVFGRRGTELGADEQ